MISPATGEKLSSAGGTRCDSRKVADTEVGDLQPGRLELGNVEHRLEVFLQNIQETVGKAPEEEERCDEDERPDWGQCRRRWDSRYSRRRKPCLRGLPLAPDATAPPPMVDEVFLEGSGRGQGLLVDRDGDWVSLASIYPSARTSAARGARGAARIRAVRYLILSSCNGAQTGPSRRTSLEQTECIVRSAHTHRVRISPAASAGAGVDLRYLQLVADGAMV